MRMENLFENYVYKYVGVNVEEENACVIAGRYIKSLFTDT